MIPRVYYNSHANKETFRSNSGGTLKHIVNILTELTLGSPVLSVDWARELDTDFISLGVATRNGTFHVINPEDETTVETITLDPPTPIWRVVGNHHAAPEACSFALATLDGGVVGVKYRQGVSWQHPFGSSCGTICFADFLNENRQLLIAGGLDRSLRGIDPRNGSLKWGQMFSSGVGFVESEIGRAHV